MKHCNLLHWHRAGFVDHAALGAVKLSAGRVAEAGGISSSARAGLEGVESVCLSSGWKREIQGTAARLLARLAAGWCCCGLILPLLLLPDAAGAPLSFFLSISLSLSA